MGDGRYSKESVPTSKMQPDQPPFSPAHLEVECGVTSGFHTGGRPGILCPPNFGNNDVAFTHNKLHMYMYMYMYMYGLLHHFGINNYYCWDTVGGQTHQFQSQSDKFPIKNPGGSLYPPS